MSNAPPGPGTSTVGKIVVSAVAFAVLSYAYASSCRLFRRRERDLEAASAASTKPSTTERYAARGVSAGKEDVHAALKAVGPSSVGIFPRAFCKIVPDHLGTFDVCVFYVVARASTALHCTAPLRS